MSSDVKRPYSSPARDEAALRTRKKIIDTARALFVEFGYASTSLKSIARGANVSEQTLYNVFGDKASLLMAVGAEIVNRGAEESVLEGEFGVALRAEPSIERRIEMVAALSRRTWEDGLVDVAKMVFEASHTDDRLAEMAAEAKKAMFEDFRAFVSILSEGQGRSDAELDEIAGLMMAIDSAGTVSTLIDDLGWSYDQYERWLAVVVKGILVD